MPCRLQVLWAFGLLICLDAVFASSEAPSRLQSRTDAMSNGERFRRGLPPKAPLRRFNASSTRANLARRSDAPTQAIIQATPHQADRKRDNTPFTTTSYVSYDPDEYEAFLVGGLIPPRSSPFGLPPRKMWKWQDSADAEVLDIAQATVFNIPAGSTGTEQHLAMTVGSDTQYLCSGLWATNGKGDYMSATDTGSCTVFFTQCDTTQTTEYGEDPQVNIWKIPTGVLGSISPITFWSNDDTKAYPSFWVNDDDENTNILIGAMKSTDIVYSVNAVQVDLSFIDVPT